jgi:hypothetical protein
MNTRKALTLTLLLMASLALASQRVVVFEEITTTSG